MELNLTPVTNIEVVFTFLLTNNDKGFSGALSFKTTAKRLDDSLVTISTDNAFYNALFGGLLNKPLSEEEEMEYNYLFELVCGLEVYIKDTETEETMTHHFSSLYSKEAVMNCDDQIKEMLDEFN